VCQWGCVLKIQGIGGSRLLGVRFLGFGLCHTALGFRHVEGASQFIGLQSVGLVEAGRWAIILDAMAKAETEFLVLFLLFRKELAIQSKDSRQIFVGVSFLGQCPWRGRQG